MDFTARGKRVDSWSVCVCPPLAFVCMCMRVLVCVCVCVCVHVRGRGRGWGRIGDSLRGGTTGRGQQEGLGGGGGIRAVEEMEVMRVTSVHRAEGQYQDLESDKGRDGKPVEGDKERGNMGASG